MTAARARLTVRLTAAQCRTDAGAAGSSLQGTTELGISRPERTRPSYFAAKRVEARCATEAKYSRMKGMEPIRDPKVLARATAAFDLCQTTEEMMRMTLRRRYPEASEKELRARFVAWVEKRPYTESAPNS